MSNNNTVTPETALRLKDAGFPQPEMKFGQYWAVPYYREKKVALVQGNGDLIGDGFGMSRAMLLHAIGSIEYCPSVIELMQVFIEEAAVPLLTFEGGQFFASVETWDESHYQSGHNPADLFGELWLRLKNAA